MIITAKGHCHRGRATADGAWRTPGLDVFPRAGVSTEHATKPAQLLKCHPPRRQMFNTNDTNVWTSQAEHPSRLSVPGGTQAAPWKQCVLRCQARPAPPAEPLTSTARGLASSFPAHNSLNLLLIELLILPFCCKSS